MSRLKISLFGSFAVTLDEQVLRNFETDKERALLAYLAVERNQAQARTKLAGLLWPEKPETRARRNLSQALYILRLLLGDKPASDRAEAGDRAGFPPFVLVQGDTLKLNPASPTWVDVHAFSALLAKAQNHPHQRADTCNPCLKNLEAAAALYRGDFLSGFWLRGSQVFDEWALVLRERLRRQALEALDALTASRAARGELEMALGHAWQQVEMEPLWEHAQRQLIDLLARNGRRDAALEQYQVYREILMDELRMPPEGATTALYERIRQQKGKGGPGSRPKGNLPSALTPFVGRRAELSELTACLDDPGCRLITVTGPGGCGKTRLALEAARKRAENFSDGVWLVSLARLDSLEAIPIAIAEALHLPLQERTSPVQQLHNFLRAKCLLLILDSHEHLLGGSSLAVDLLREAPEVKVLATSRQRLHVQGEQLFILGGLGIPQTGDGLEATRHREAVQLFVLAGQRARPGFELSAGNVGSVHRICQITEGMSLGLLLAAAWLDTFSSAEVAAEIEYGLDFLAAEWGDQPARQRSLRATFDYSWGLLGESESRVLRRLAVFRGGFKRQAAVQVAGATLQHLRALVEKSMLERSLSGRYGIHELLRQYAWEKMRQSPAEARAALKAHSAYYLGKLPGWDADLKGPHQVDVLGEMDLEIGNLGAAWNWAVERQEVDQLALGLEGLCLFYGLRARLEEGHNACQQALDHMPAGHRPQVQRFRMRASTRKAHFLRQLGQHEAAESLLREIQEALEGPDHQDQDNLAVRALVHLELGHAMLPSDRGSAREQFQTCLALAESTGDCWVQAQAWAGLGMVAHHAGTFAEAVTYYQQSLALYEPLGDPKSIAGVLIELGHNALRQGQLVAGEAYIHRGCEIYEQIGDRASMSDSLFQLARLYFWHGKFSEMLPLIDKTRPIFEELGWNEQVLFNVTGKGIPLAFNGKYDAAFRQGQEGLALAQEHKVQRWQAATHWVMGMARLGGGDFQAAREYLQLSVEEYRSISQNDELGWALAALAYAKLKLQPELAFRETLVEALEQGLEIKGLLPVLLCLPAAALDLLKQSQAIEGDGGEPLIERAVELYALARRYPVAGNAQWFEDVAGKKIALAAARLPAGVVEAARQRGQSQEPFSVAQDLLAEYRRG